MIRAVFLTGGAIGSGHIALGCGLGLALNRKSTGVDFSIITVKNEFSSLASKFGFQAVEVPIEPAESFGEARVQESALYKAIVDSSPDILVSDLHWFPLASFVRGLPCKKAILFRQIDPRYFRLRLPDRDIAFEPADYDLVVKTEPGFELPFPSTEIEPMVMRNREEVMDAGTARADLGLAPDDRTCLFAFNGAIGEGARAWKSFSYLEDEGLKVIRSDNRAGGLFPAVDWFNAFDMLVCGAGYSAFWEARFFRKEAYFVPFKRVFEDQARRVALCSDYEFDVNGADTLASMLLSL